MGYDVISFFVAPADLSSNIQVSYQEVVRAGARKTGRTNTHTNSTTNAQICVLKMYSAGNRSLLYLRFLGRGPEVRGANEPGVLQQVSRRLRGRLGAVHVQGGRSHLSQQQQQQQQNR